MSEYSLGTARGVIQIDYKGNGPKRAAADLKTTGAAAGTAGVNVGKLRGQLLTLAGIGSVAAIAAGFVAAVKTVSDFETSLSAVGAVSGATGEQMESLRAKALQLGADTAFSASEGALAMEELAKAGLSVDNILGGAADATVALAAAGGIDLPTAAGIASAAMNSFNIAATDTAKIADLFAGAANRSATDVVGIGEAFKYVAPLAANTGVSIEDTTTAIAALAKAGISGSMAGTTLRSMLQRLNPASKGASKAMEELGIITEEQGNRFFDAEGNTKSMAEISGVLAESLSGLSDEQKSQALTTIFGSRAMTGALALADQGVDGFTELGEAIGEVSAADVAAKRLDNLAGSMEALGGSIETVVIKSLTAAAGGLRTFVDGLTLAINTASEVGGDIAGKISPGFADLGTTIANVVGIVLEVIDVFDELIGLAAKLSLGAIIVTFNALASTLATVTGLLEGQGAVVAVVAGTWLLLANGGIAVVSARLGYFAAYAVVQALGAMTALQGGAVATSVALKTLAASAATAAASLGAVAVLVAAVVIWQAYKDAVEETEEALDAAADAKKSGDFGAIEKQIADIEELIEARQRVIDDVDVTNLSDAGKLLNNIFNPTRYGDISKLGEFKDSLNELGETADGLGQTLTDMSQGVTDVGVQLGLLDQGDADALLELFDAGDPAGIEGLEGLLTEIQPQLDKAGISAQEFLDSITGVGDMSLTEIQFALAGVANKADGAAGSTDTLADAAKGFENDAMSAADAAKVLEEAFDSLIGVELSADAAGIKWREGLRDLKEQILETNGSIKAGTVAGDSNRTSIIGSTEDLLARVSAEAKAGTSLKDLTGILSNGRNELIKNSVEAGVNRDKMVALLKTYNFTPKAIRTLVEAVGVDRATNGVKKLMKQYNITPEEKKTIIEAAGAKTAAEEVKALRAHIKKLKGKDAKIDTPGAVGSAKEIKKLREEIRVLEGKAAKIGTPGAAAAAREVQRLKDRIDALRDRDVQVTTTLTTIRESIRSGKGFREPGKLASGGVTNGPTYALIGDNPGGKEAVTPLAWLEDQIRKVWLAGRESTALASTSGSAPRSSPGGSAGGALRMVEGKLSLDESGFAFIEGVAVDVYNDEREFTNNRPGGHRG